MLSAGRQWGAARAIESCFWALLRGNRVVQCRERAEQESLVHRPGITDEPVEPKPCMGGTVDAGPMAQDPVPPFRTGNFDSGSVPKADALGCPVPPLRAE